MYAIVHGERYECAHAEKGAKHVALFDAAGDCVARFDGISDFSGYEVEGGEWTEVMNEPDYTAFLAGLMEGYVDE